VILREALGADVLVHFMIKAPAVLTEDARELAHDVGAEAVEAVERGAMAGESEFLARLSPRTNVQQGQPLEVVVDVHRLHFFDPESGQGIYGGNGEPDRSRSS
jgi:multiple sugar transport system ATP-binding protein